MYAKRSWRWLVGATEEFSPTRVDFTQAVMVEGPFTECCARQVTKRVKCTQGDGRPLGGDNHP